MSSIYLRRLLSISIMSSTASDLLCNCSSRKHSGHWLFYELGFDLSCGHVVNDADYPFPQILNIGFMVFLSLRSDGIEDCLP